MSQSRRAREGSSDSGLYSGITSTLLPSQLFTMTTAKLWIILYVLSISSVQSLKWLSMASLSSSPLAMTSETSVCSQMKGLERRQKRVCRQHSDIMMGVMDGANMSILECQHQFQHSRWNCSMINEENIFGGIVNKGTREAAYIHAITAAGVSVAVTKGCSRGRLPGCGCDRSKSGNAGSFTWAGCSDNVLFGSAFSKKFTDARERLKNSNGRSIMNLHNNQAGREIVEKHMTVDCKCHGVSGSCELRTCWRSLPPFRKVGNLLKDAFDGATEVKSRKKSKSLRLQLKPANKKYKPYTAKDLVYLRDSPDFCKRNETLGSLGTSGRECNKDSKNVDGCDLLCCDRGYHTRVETVVERCRCKFVWCCFVQCEECKRQVEKNICL